MAPDRRVAGYCSYLSLALFAGLAANAIFVYGVLLANAIL